MKITIFILFFGVLAQLSSFVAAEPRVQIGISTALTGEAATYGTDLRNAMIFANKKLAQGRYELIFEDDKCNGKDAVTVAQRFINVLHLKYVAGFACSSTVLSTANLYEKNKTLVMISSASAPEISAAGDYIFRTWSSDELASAKLFEYAQRTHKKIGVLNEETDYTRGLVNAFTRAAKGRAVQLTFESHLPEAGDLRTSIVKMMGQKVDALVVFTQAEAGLALVMKHVRELNWKVPVLTAYMGATPNFLERAGLLAEGVVSVDFPPFSQILNSDGRELMKEFNKEFGDLKSIEGIFVSTFEAFRALDAAIQSGEDQRKFLYEAKFHGIFGDWYFDKNGDIQGLPFVIKRIEKGKPVVIVE